AEDALRVLKHQLRIFNRNQAMKITRRSTGAQRSIKEHDGAPSKNGSGSALHSDHVHPLNRDQLVTLTSVDMWLAVLDQLREVVGWAKYPEASVELVQQDGEDWASAREVAVTDFPTHVGV
ncbi:MAG: hypothetical protein ACXVX9_14415, partial [Mycobacteriaceae bacterium]